MGTATWKRLYLGIPVATATLLWGCGGGSEPKEQTPAPVSVKLSGIVYDGPVTAAAVDIYLGDTKVGSSISDADGRYAVEISGPATDSGKQLVIKAKRGPVTLVTLPGTLETVAAAKTSDGTVSDDAFPGINPTNVSTAIYAVVKRDAGTPDSLTATALKQAKEAIRANPDRQAEVLNVAAAIKAVVDHGADVSTVGSSTDTLALAEYVVTQVATDPTADDTALTSLASAAGVSTTDLTTAVTSDLTVSSQLLLADVATTNLNGARFAVGSDTLLVLNSGGTLNVYDYAGIVTGADAGTWTFNEAGQKLSMVINSTDGTTEAIDVQFNGGSVDTAIPATATFAGNNESQSVVLRRANELTAMNQIPRWTFSNSGKFFQYPATCDGTTANAGFLATTTGSYAPTCLIKNGALLFSTSPPTDISGGNPAEATYKVRVPLAGTDNKAFNLAHWEQNIDTGHRTTLYRSFYAPISRTLPVDGSGTLRVTAENDVQLALVDQRLTTTCTTATCVKIYREKANGTAQAALQKNVFLRNEPNMAVDYTASDSDEILTNGGTTAVFRLSGGTATVYKEGLLSNITVDGLGNIATTPGTTKSMVRTTYPLTDFAAVDVSGKTFSYANKNGIVGGTVQFNSDYTVVMDGVSYGTWSVHDKTAGSPAFPYNTIKIAGADFTEYLFKTAVDKGAGHLIGILNITGASEAVSMVTVTEQ